MSFLSWLLGAFYGFCVGIISEIWIQNRYRNELLERALPFVQGRTVDNTEAMNLAGAIEKQIGL